MKQLLYERINSAYSPWNGGGGEAGFAAAPRKGAATRYLSASLSERMEKQASRFLTFLLRLSPSFWEERSVGRKWSAPCLSRQRLSAVFFGSTPPSEAPPGTNTSRAGVIFPRRSPSTRLLTRPNRSITRFLLSPPREAGGPRSP